MKKILPTLLFTLLLPCLKAQEVLDISGEWEFQVDRKETVRANDKFDDCILLPGSMPQRLKGDKPSTKTVWTGSFYGSSYFHNPFTNENPDELRPGGAAVQK